MPEQLEGLRLWDGSPIPPGLRRRVLRVYAHYTFLSAQIAEVEAERQAQLQASADTHIDKVRQLMLLKGIGINGAWLLVMEFFGWRTFKNRREVGGLAALRRHHIKAAKVRGNKGSPSRQPARALDDHGVGLELAPLSAGQRPECGFVHASGAGQALATDWDCGCVQVTHCALALARDRVPRSGAQRGISAGLRWCHASVWVLVEAPSKFGPA